MTEEEHTVELQADAAGTLDFAGGLPPGAKLGFPLMLGSIALNMAMKYHDFTVIKDGAMYQQYKLEGRNMREIGLDIVFETAKKIEEHLMATNERIASLLIEALVVEVDEKEGKE